MLSDDSSTDSESGRFKSHSKSDRKESKHSSQLSREGELLPDLARNKSGNRYTGRDFDRRYEERGQFGRRRSRDRFDQFRRNSPPRRRFSRDRSPVMRRSSERHRNPREGESSKHRENRENKEERTVKKTENIQKYAETRKFASPKGQYETKRDFREEIRKNVAVNVSKEKIEEQNNLADRRKLGRDKYKESDKSSRGDIHSKVYAAGDIVSNKNRSRSPVKEKAINIEKEVRQSKTERQSNIDDVSYAKKVDVEQPTSYYNLVPAAINVINDEETIHSVTDSSEDEAKLRARLLNLEKELSKSKKKKSKKSKKKSKSKHKDRDSLVEVSSTTDVQDTNLVEDDDKSIAHMQAAEVSSTEHRSRKDSSEEGEISSDDDSTNVSIEPSDLRHRLKRSTVAPDTSGSPDLRDKLRPKTDVMGPALPPHMVKFSSSSEIEGASRSLHKDRNIGPTIPNNVRKILAESSYDRTEDHHSSSDEGIGPLPVGQEEKWLSAHKKLEERALHMKIQSLDGGSNKSHVAGREEWMLELPEAKAKHLGLGPRQFRNREAPDMSDRSSWTDTPREKELKAAGLAPSEESSTSALQRTAQQRHVEDRDREQEKAAKKHKKKHKREESLLEMHEKKLKKKKKKDKEDGKPTRRPFDRDVDLQVNRFDDAQKKAIIKKAQHLDSRFSRGEAKYL